MKYIVVRLGNTQKAVVFTPYLTHAVVAQNLGFKEKNVISAGFVHLDQEGNLTCYGKSVSLRLRSRPEDADIIMEDLGVPDIDEKEPFRF